MPLLASTPRLVIAGLTSGLLVLAACSSSSGGGGTGASGTGGTGGGPVSGTADAHCSGVASQATSQADCHLTSDAGADDGGGSDYGDTMYNAEGDDDDCKYHVKWSSTPIGENRDVTFTVTATTKTDGMPAGSGTGAGADANVLAEVYLSDTHPAPNTDQVSDETSPGTYSVGPIRFDAPGRWTVRFHFYEACTDVADDSPHGHAAFYVDVP